jgi:O-antigen/teichoic acid export membrane protein
VALRFASLAGIVVVGFQLAWQPHAFSMGLGADARAEIGRDGRRILVLVSTVVVAVAVVAPEAILLLSGDRYVGAIPIVGFALVLQLATAAVMVASMPSAMAKSMGNIGVASVVGVTVGVASNIILAPVIGGAGTAVSMALGQGTAASVVWFLGRGLVLPVGWPRCLVVMAAASVVAVASTAALGEPVVARLILASIFVVFLIWEGTTFGLLRRGPAPVPEQRGR